MRGSEWDRCEGVERLVSYGAVLSGAGDVRQ